MGERVLITGRTGFVGSHRADALALNSHTVIDLDNVIVASSRIDQWRRCVHEGAYMRCAYMKVRTYARRIAPRLPSVEQLAAASYIYACHRQARCGVARYRPRMTFEQAVHEIVDWRRQQQVAANRPDADQQFATRGLVR